MTSGLPLLVAALTAAAVLLWPAVAGRSRSTRDAGPALAGPRPAQPPARRPSPWRWPVPARLHPWRSSRVSAAEEVQLLDGLAAALEAGLPTDHAVRVALEPVLPAGPDGAAWSDLARAAQEGQPLGPAWQRLARRTGSRTAASVARAWTVAAVTGAPVAAAVRTSAHAARERRRLERAVETATAGARATATVLGLLPLAGVGLAGLLGVGPLSLYSHPLAMASAGLGVVLLVVGHLTVRRMVAGVLRGVS